MGKLSKAIAYLAGPIDCAADDGVEWRQQMTKVLEELGVKVLDPTRKLWDATHEIGKEKDRNIQLKKQGKYKELAVLAKRMRHEDLRCVDICDFIVAFVDPNIHMCGTYDEIFAAERQKKPILVVINGGRGCTPTWLFDVFPLDDMFDTFADLAERLENINNGSYGMDTRWVLLRDHL